MNPQIRANDQHYRVRAKGSPLGETDHESTVISLVRGGTQEQGMLALTQKASFALGPYLLLLHIASPKVM